MAFKVKVLFTFFNSIANILNSSRNKSSIQPRPLLKNSLKNLKSKILTLESLPKNNSSSYETNSRNPISIIGVIKLVH